MFLMVEANRVTMGDALVENALWLGWHSQGGPRLGCHAVTIILTYDFMDLNADFTTAKGSRKSVDFCTYDTLLLNK